MTNPVQKVNCVCGAEIYEISGYWRALDQTCSHVVNGSEESHSPDIQIPHITDRMQGVDCELCENGEFHTHGPIAMTNPVQKVERPESCTVALNNGIDEHRLPERATIYIDLMKHEIAYLNSKLEAAENIDHRVREQLWISHRCSQFLYGDDGEMQCCRLPFIDFKRNTFQEIMDGISLHNLLRMQESELAKHKESQL